jgi:predicted secreted protein
MNTATFPVHPKPLKTLLLAAALSLAALAAVPAARAQTQAMMPMMMKDVLNLDATVQTQVTPDLAVVMLAAERSGADSAGPSAEVTRAINEALKEARAVTGIQASTGGFTTFQRFDNKGQRTGWTVRAEVILKGKDFTALGKLAGKLTQAGPNALQITNNSFEVSTELRNAEEAKLMERAIAEFRRKAQVATSAFGYRKFSIQQVNVGTTSGFVPPQPRPMLRVAAMAAAAPEADMPIQAGSTELSLTVSGSVQMEN